MVASTHTNQIQIKFPGRINTMNKNVRIAIIIIAAAIVLATAAFFVYKNRIVKTKEPAALNITMFKCHMGKTITDSDLARIKEVVTKAVGDKVLDIRTGDVPLARTQYITDENGEYIDVGDIVTIEFSVLTDEEQLKILNAIIQAYDLDKPYLNDIYEIKSIHRSDVK